MGSRIWNVFLERVFGTCFLERVFLVLSLDSRSRNPNFNWGIEREIDRERYTPMRCNPFVPIRENQIRTLLSPRLSRSLFGGLRIELCIAK